MQNSAYTLKAQKNGSLKPEACWQRVRFGDVVECVNDTVSNPQADGIERVVGLEHLDPGSLHIKRWADIEEGTTFTRRFRSGQVLFGKRRAYQRKLAVAEFDGICSGDILVFEPKDDSLISELLPFVMQAESFWQHALDTSAGSLSPRTKWQDLARYEFALPPKDEQRRIAEILWVAQKSLGAWESLHLQLTDAIDLLREETIYGSGRSADWPVRSLAEITKQVTKGESPGWQGFHYQKEGVRFVTSENVHKDRLEPEPTKFIPDDFHQKLSRSSIEAGDVLVTLVGGSLGRACLMPPEFTPANVNQAVAVIRPDPSLAMPEYLLSCLQSPSGYSRLLGAKVETFKANISLSVVRNFPIPLPPISFQAQFCAGITALKDSRKRAVEMWQTTIRLREGLVSHFLETNNV